jgi:hypothetical protein
MYLPLHGSTIDMETRIKQQHLIISSHPLVVQEDPTLSSCDIVALRENFVDRPESYDSFSCVFLAHGLGVYFSIPLHNLAQSKVKEILKTFTYYSRTITNLTKFDFPLPRDQTSRSRIWPMISEKFKCVTFNAALDDVRYS